MFVVRFRRALYAARRKSAIVERIFYLLPYPLAALIEWIRNYPKPFAFNWITLIISIVLTLLMFGYRLIQQWRRLNHAPRPVLSEAMKDQLSIFLAEKSQNCDTPITVSLVDYDGNDSEFCKQIGEIMNGAQWQTSMGADLNGIFGLTEGITIFGGHSFAKQAAVEAFSKIGLTANLLTPPTCPPSSITIVLGK